MAHKGFVATVDNHRLVTRLQESGRLPMNVHALRGFKLFETVNEESKAALSVILGPYNTGRRGRKPQAIDVELERGKRPTIDGNLLLRADVLLEGDSFKLVRQEKTDVALRTIKTGLLPDMRGSTTQDFANLAAAGVALRYHGAFPLTADAATIVGEGVDIAISAESKIITDERFGRINGLAGVPRIREVMIEGVIGGPVLVGQIDGVLMIHELTADGWKVHDVTNSPHWQKKFMDLASQDVVFLNEQAAAKRQDKKVRILRPPSDHMDA